MSFQARMSEALPHESAVKQRLESIGWIVCPFGQAMLSGELRSLLLRIRPASPVRWLPDFVAAKQEHDASVRSFFVDAKGGRTDTKNYSFEIASVESQKSLSIAMKTEAIFITKDFKVLTPEIIETQGWEGPRRSNGSGTPYYLVEKWHGIPFDDMFGNLSAELSLAAS